MSETPYEPATIRVTLDVQATDVGKQVTELIASLPEAKKHALAEEMIRSWLSQASLTERPLKEAEVFKMLRDTHRYKSLRSYSNKTFGTATDQELRDTSEYETAMQGFQSLHEELFDGLRQTIHSWMLVRMEQLVKDDPRMQRIIAATGALLYKAAPAMLYVHLANSVMKMMQPARQEMDLARFVGDTHFDQIVHDAEASLAADATKAAL